jgi:hypothetical protein
MLTRQLDTRLNGIRRYLNESANAALVIIWLGAATTAAQAAQVRIQTVPAIEMSGGYQHRWLANLRSNATFGYAYYKYNSTIIGPVESLQCEQQEIRIDAAVDRRQPSRTGGRQG